MSIAAISSSPAARLQSTAEVSAAASVSATLASSSLQLNARAQELISKLKQQAPDPQQHQAGHLSNAGYTYSPAAVSAASTDKLQINTAPGRTAEEAIARAHAIEAAALASDFPSSADRAVAVQAQQLAAQAQAALAALQQAPAPAQASVPAAAPVQASTVTNTANTATVTAASPVNKAYGDQSPTAPSLDTYA